MDEISYPIAHPLPGFPLTHVDSTISNSNPAHPNHPRAQLESLLSESERGDVARLLAIAVDTDLQESLILQLLPLVTQQPNLKRGLPFLVRFLDNVRTPTSFVVFLDRDRDALPSLLQILSMDTSAVAWLVSDPDSFDWLRLSAGQAVDPDHLKDTLISEIQHLDDESQVLACLNRFRKRETLRVICAVGLHDMPLHVAAQQFAWIADAGIAAAFYAANAERHLDNKARSAAIRDLSHGLCFIGVGALGGQELELEGTIELVVLRDADELLDDPRRAYWQDELLRLVERTIDWVSSPEGLGYEVLLPLNTGDESVEPRLAIQDYRRWIQSIENHGRTWQRLALIKSRYVAGDPLLAARYLEELPSLVYSRYLTRADIAGIGALKRKFDRDEKSLEPLLPDVSSRSLEILQSWKKEIEFLIHFLQWTNGGELEGLRVGNTVLAMDELAKSGCLTEQEKSILAMAYTRFYQAIFAIQVSQPLDRHRSTMLGSNLLASNAPAQVELSDSWDRVKQIRDHLRGDVFADESQASEETDLILDPNPKPEWVDQILAKYRFKRPNAAYRFLMELSREEVTMLSTRRCRHFLSIIAARLLEKISKTPDPDLTLENLAITCRSLGGKGVLWELFSVHEPSLDLYVRLCGASPYLIGILTSNPGMIDELLDSLMLNRLPTEQQLGKMLHELCRGADDIDPIVHSFKNARHLNVGVRDILGKESIADTHRALADIADVCLQQTVHTQYSLLVKRFGVPTKADNDACRFAVVAMGKLGGREPNYHSDVSLLFLYDQEGTTKPFGAIRHHEPIAAEYFFHQLAQKVSQVANRVGRSGRLYETKNWLVSPNRNTTLAWSLEEIHRFFCNTPGLALQRQQLCNARCIVGDPDFQQEVHLSIRTILKTRMWTGEDKELVLSERKRLEESAGERNLKRGKGGTMDVETLVHLLILEHLADNEDLLVNGTLEAIERLRLHGLIESTDADTLRDGYNFLRGVESGLRLMNTLARHDLPSSEIELSRLAYVLKLHNGPELEEACNRYRGMHRALYEKYL